MNLPFSWKVRRIRADEDCEKEKEKKEKGESIRRGIKWGRVVGGNTHKERSIRRPVAR